MSSDIPLVKDILDVYPDAKLDELVDSKMVEMHNNFTSGNNNIKYTDEEVYNYIKFVNITCLDTNSYKHIVKYINKDNILYFDGLFDNYDILYELLPLLPYETVCDYSRLEDPQHKEIKDRWLLFNPPADVPVEEAPSGKNKYVSVSSSSSYKCKSKIGKRGCKKYVDSSSSDSDDVGYNYKSCCKRKVTKCGSKKCVDTSLCSSDPCGLYKFYDPYTSGNSYGLGTSGCCSIKNNKCGKKKQVVSCGLDNNFCSDILFNNAKFSSNCSIGGNLFSDGRSNNNRSYGYGCGRTTYYNGY